MTHPATPPQLSLFEDTANPQNAEREALESAVLAGVDVRGATAWVTLEPCCHQGKQPPCTDALIEAGIARVIAAQRDPNPLAAGGFDVLRAAGGEVRKSEAARMAGAASEPFVKRMTTGLPWVTAKWAQTIDGRVATRSGESKWISGPMSRRRVHRRRGMSDVVLTAIGGWFFATTYARTRSLWLASFEHALYGQLVFTVGLGQYFYGGTVQMIDGAG